MIEFDVETTSLQWYAGELFLAQFLLPGESTARILRHPQDKAEIQRLLGFDDDYRAWNSKFDLHFLDAAGYTLPDPKRWHDGMVMAQLMDERISSALKSRGTAMFGPEASDNERLVKGWLKEEKARRRAESKATGVQFVPPNYSNVPDDIMFPYAGGDVELQRRVCDQLEKTLDPGLRELYELEMRVMEALFFMEKRGFRIDVPMAEAFEHELESDLDKLTGEAIDLSGIATFNPNSGDQVGEALMRRGADLTFARTLKNGLPSVDEETLEAVDDPLAEKVLELRRTKKQYGTYVHPMMYPTEKSGILRAPFIAAADGRLHPNFRQVGARHGRMSASDPNVQNWPRDDLRLRYLAIPTEGNVFVASDLDAVEMRLLGAFTGEGPVYEMILSGEDLHAHTAKMVGLLDRDRGGGVIESARQRGKKFNYERIFGGGIRAIRKHHRVPQPTAKKMYNAYLEAYPEVQEFQEQIEATLEDKGYVKDPFNRRHRVRDRRFVDSEAYKFVNYLISGTAATILKRAIVRCHEAGVPMVNTVHDEILADNDPDTAEEVGEFIREALIDQPEITGIVPLDADAKIVDRWSQAKDKNYVPDYARSHDA